MALFLARVCIISVWHVGLIQYSLPRRNLGVAGGGKRSLSFFLHKNSFFGLLSWSATKKIEIFSQRVYGWCQYKKWKTCVLRDAEGTRLSSDTRRRSCFSSVLAKLRLWLFVFIKSHEEIKKSGHIWDLRFLWRWRLRFYSSGMWRRVLR